LAGVMMEFAGARDAGDDPRREDPERIERAPVGGIEIAYEQFGDPSDETVLLVMGLGMQMLGWDEELCELIAGEGFHVVRFDNRDVGLSSKLGGRVNLRAGMLGFTGSARYTLDEMAADAVGLLDHLGIERAHLVGASMGGMISHKLAAHHPDRVASLCSIMSGSGRRRLATLPRPDVLRMLLRAPASGRDAFIEDTVAVFERIGSPGFPVDIERLRERAGRSFDRSFDPSGTARQMMAILASGDRSGELRRISAPTLIIHGAADRLIPPAAARELAATIPGAQLELVAGMGHDLPMQLWPRFVELIAANPRRARAGAAAAAE
jgi:pimeloyl-ACP methyl ester carboxylesterase